MFLLSRLFLLLTQTADERQKARHDAYLAEATDLYDLEFRMRKLDREVAVAQPSWQAAR